MSGEKRVRRVVGCMTGTSIDGLDVSLVEIEGEGLAMRAKVARSLSRELGEMSGRLRELAEQKPLTAGAIAALARDFALLHAGAIQELLAGERADLVCVHGQTVFHAPPLSWQLMQPAPIAAELGCPVVYDLRQADLAAGGQGAPITPIADWILFRRQRDPLAVVNLGGFANYSQWMTNLCKDEEFPSQYGREFNVLGGDICACNQLLDGIARVRLGRPYDEGGTVAYSGVMHDEAYERMCAVLRGQRASKRSLGTGDELESLIAEFKNISNAALLRSACEAIATVVLEATGNWCAVVVAGGGVRNKGLMTALGSRRGEPVHSTSEYGVPVEFREAAEFAVLGALCQDRVPITIPTVTGVKEAPVSGAWVYP